MRPVTYPWFAKLFFPNAIKSFPAHAGKLFFTFDDGPNPETTPYIISILKKYNCTATFFCLGENAEQYPELIQLIKNEGHSIGNHGYSHKSGFKMSSTQFLNNIIRADSLLNSKLYRPPYGHMTPWQYKVASKQFSIILWDTMCYDFDQNLSSEKCLAKIKKYAKAGSIIVFHDNLKSIEKLKVILPAAIEHIITNGCLISTLPVFKPDNKQL